MKIYEFTIISKSGTRAKQIFRCAANKVTEALIEFVEQINQRGEEFEMSDIEILNIAIANT